MPLYACVYSTSKSYWHNITWSNKVFCKIYSAHNSTVCQENDILFAMHSHSSRTHTHTHSQVTLNGHLLQLYIVDDQLPELKPEEQEANSIIFLPVKPPIISSMHVIIKFVTLYSNTDTYYAHTNAIHINIVLQV